VMGHCDVKGWRSVMKIEALAESGKWVRDSHVLCCFVWLVMRDGGITKYMS